MSSDAYPVSPRTTPTRLKDRVSYDRAAVHAVLDEAVLCHVGMLLDGLPVVLPQLHVRVGEELFLHGSSGSRVARTADSGALPVCVTVTLLDGLVLARSAFHHSLNYRSVVVHGLAEPVVEAAAKEAAMTHLVNAIVPGRSDHVRGPSRRELAATTVLRVPLDQVSLKVRTGPPVDEEEDLDLPFWAGVLPVDTVPGAPVPAPNLRHPIPVPEHVSRWHRSPEAPSLS